MTQNIRLSSWLRPLALFAAFAVCVTGPAHADIQLRVESRPNTEVIEAFVRVTDGAGPVTALTPADFAVTLDGAALDTFTLSLPPDQDPAQKVSVVVVMAYRISAASSIVEAAADFINQMAIGDYAAVVTFRISSVEGNYQGRPVVHSFTQIDGGAGTTALIDFLPVAFSSRMSGVRLFDGISLAVGQFASPPVALPNGPKAIILIGNVHDTFSFDTLSDVLAYANENSIAIFTVGVGNIAEDLVANRLMAVLAEETGGTYLTANNNVQIDEALTDMAGLLTDAYLLSIPQSAVTDCFPHVLEVTSQRQSESIAFTRCDSTPDELYFTTRENVAPGTVVVSDAATITGADSPIAISVDDGEYSIGCSGTFTAVSGFIFPGDRVCVRHTASANFASETLTVLITGGVSSRFWSMTSAAPQPPAVGGGSGGGAAGAIELLLVLGTLLLWRRKIRR